MIYTRVRTLLGFGKVTVVTATCPMCGVRVPADPDGWDTLCYECAKAEAAEVRRLRATRYCWRCNGPHNPFRVHLNDPNSGI